MSAEEIKKTQQAFEGLITKPALTPEDLKRPRFTYILHIIVSTNRASKIGTGLFTSDELTKGYYDPSKVTETSDQEEIKEEIKKRKEMLLKKILKLISMINEEPIAANPKAIMAGKECDKTNQFLQGLARAAKSGKDFGPATKKLNAMIEAKQKKEQGGDANPRKEEPKQKQEERQEPPKQKADEPRQRVEEPKAKESTKNKNPESNFEKKVEDQVKKENFATDEVAQQEDESKIKFGSLKRKTRGNTVTAGPNKGPQFRQQMDEDGTVNPAALTSIESMKETIQKVTQSTTRLGKIVEFVDDDIESMSKEYENWSIVYSNSKIKLEEKENEIDDMLQTYKDKITTKEEQVRERKSQIESMKTQILRNNEKIQKLLSGIVGA